MTKEVIIVALIVLVIYLYYRQNNQPSLNTQPNNQEIQELKNQVNHYQTLYQKRIAKDIEIDQSQKIRKLEESNQQLTEEFQNYKTSTEKEKSDLVSQENEVKELYQQKITDLETSLLNLAQQKIKGKKDAQRLLQELETNWKQDKELWKETEKNYSEQLAEAKNGIQQKENIIINLNQSYEKLETQFKDKDNLAQELVKNKEKASQELTELKATHRKELKIYQTKLEQETEKLTNLTHSFSDLQTENKEFLKEKQELIKDSQKVAKSANEQEQKLIEAKELNQKFITFFRKELGVGSIEEVRKKINGQTLIQIINQLELKNQTIKEIEKENQVRETKLAEQKNEIKEIKKEASLRNQEVIDGTNEWKKQELAKLVRKRSKIEQEIFEGFPELIRELRKKRQIQNRGRIFNEEYCQDLQEWLDWKYPTPEARNKVEEISSKKILIEITNRLSTDPTLCLAENRALWLEASKILDLTSFSNLKRIELTNYPPKFLIVNKNQEIEMIFNSDIIVQRGDELTIMKKK